MQYSQRIITCEQLKKLSNRLKCLMMKEIIKGNLKYVYRLKE
jgi:hypothetical protein